jgi:hypothetical protein
VRRGCDPLEQPILLLRRDEQGDSVTFLYFPPHRPLVCADETSKQLIAETRVPMPMKPGRPGRFDHEYERNGTANTFMMFAPLEGWRQVTTPHRRAPRE